MDQLPEKKAQVFISHDNLELSLRGEEGEE